MVAFCLMDMVRGRARYSRSVALSVAFVLLLKGSWGDSLGSPRPEKESPTATAASALTSKKVSAKAFYCKQCQRCHDQDGRGGKARPNSPEIPDFSSEHWQKSRSDAQLTVSILEGKGTAMPPFAGRLARKEVRELVTHVHSYRAKPSGPPNSEQDDFSKRFRELQKELDGLRRQFRELCEKNSKP